MKHQLRSSPHSVVRKTSSFTDYNIDFLGFNFEVFIQEGGEKVVRNVSVLQMQELNGFLAATASKVLTSWTSYGATDALNGDLIIKVRLAPHASATDYFADAKSEFNRGTSGSGVDPVRGLGTTMVSLGWFKSYFMPDYQLKVLGRIDNSPNIVFENHYHSSVSIRDFIAKLKNYIFWTSNVVDAVGVLIYDTGALLLVHFDRVALNTTDLASHCISFGTAALPLNDLNEVNMHTGRETIGFGAGAPNDPCNEANQEPYIFTINNNHLLRIDNDGAQVNQQHPPVEGVHYVLKLYTLQRLILSTLP